MAWRGTQDFPTLADHPRRAGNLNGSGGVGSATGALIAAVLGVRRHPRRAYRSCLGALLLMAV